MGMLKTKSSGVRVRYYSYICLFVIDNLFAVAYICVQLKRRLLGLDDGKSAIIRMMDDYMMISTDRYPLLFFW